MPGLTPSSPLYTIVTVDDDPAVLDVLTKYLTLHGMRVVSTSDPETVVDLVLREKPRLVISDIAMPGLTGLELLKRLKENSQTRDVPFILLTSSKNGDDVREGLNSGAEAYLIKPLEWDAAWPKIQSILLRS